MATMTPASRAKARATRARNLAGQPLYMVAKAVKISPSTLRAKLLYHGQKTSGVTVAELLNTLQTKTRTKITPAMLAKLNGNGAAPPIYSNPRAATNGAAASTHGHAHEPPVSEEDREFHQNMKLAHMALNDAEKLILSRLQPGRYGWAEVYTLEAVLFHRIGKPRPDKP